MCFSSHYSLIFNPMLHEKVVKCLPTKKHIVIIIVFNFLFVFRTVSAYNKQNCKSIKQNFSKCFLFFYFLHLYLMAKIFKVSFFFLSEKKIEINLHYLMLSFSVFHQCRESNDRFIVTHKCVRYHLLTPL